MLANLKTWTDLDGLGGRRLGGLERTWTVLKGLGRTWTDLGDLDGLRAWGSGHGGPGGLWEAFHSEIYIFSEMPVVNKDTVP
jgi:hypothetical protein